MAAGTKPPAKEGKRGKKWTLVPVLDASDRKKLRPVHLEQLAVLSTFYDGLATSVETIPPGMFSKWVNLSKVLEDGVHRFDVWRIGADSGCVFWKGDKEPLGIEIIQGGWDAYPKVGWVKRGLALDLNHLAWELAYRDAPPPAGVVGEGEPASRKPEPMRWKPRRVRKSPDDFE